MLRIARFVGEHAFESQELLPEFQRIAVWGGLSSTRLQIRLGLEHVLLADAVEVAFQSVEIRRIVEQRADDFSKPLGARHRQRIPVAEFDEVLQTHVVEVRGDHMVDLVRVELAVRVHVVRVLVDAGWCRSVPGTASASGVCVRSANIIGVDSTSTA